jgi:hypothetical protein
MRYRRPVYFTAAGLAGLLAALLIATVALAAETTLTTTLRGGDAEVPPGDPDGSGSASVTLDPATGQVCWEITVMNIMPATASHIHVGEAGVAGGVVVPLDTDGFEGSSEGCVEDQDADVLQAIIDDPPGHYVNVHTSDYGGGAVRGQLGAAPDTAVAGRPLPLAEAGMVLLVAAAALLGLRRMRDARAR